MDMDNILPEVRLDNDSETTLIPVDFKKIQLPTDELDFSRLILNGQELKIHSENLVQSYAILNTNRGYNGTLMLVGIQGIGTVGLVDKVTETDPILKIRKEISYSQYSKLPKAIDEYFDKYPDFPRPDFYARRVSVDSRNKRLFVRITSNDRGT